MIAVIGVKKNDHSRPIAAGVDQLADCPQTAQTSGSVSALRLMDNRRPVGNGDGGGRIGGCVVHDDHPAHPGQIAEHQRNCRLFIEGRNHDSNFVEH